MKTDQLALAEFEHSFKLASSLFHYYFSSHPQGTQYSTNNLKPQTSKSKMSFLYKTTPVIRTTIRSTVARSSTRCLSTTVVQHKSATDTVKDGLKTVDRAVSDVAVAGIDKGGLLALSPSHLSVLTLMQLN